MYLKSREETLEIDGNNYTVIPNIYLEMEDYFDKQCNYEKLVKLSRENYQGSISQSDFNADHLALFKNILNLETCNELISMMAKNPNAINSKQLLEQLLVILFQGELDESICSYFGSFYSIFWYTGHVFERKVDSSMYSINWHCDTGPKKHLKLMAYLNSSKQHGANTLFLNEQQSLALKKLGYLFNDVRKRVPDVTPLLEHTNQSTDTFAYDIDAGDVLLFNPNILGHRGKIPNPHQTRYTITFCILPSPLPWQHVYNSPFKPKYGGVSFDDWPKQLLSSLTPT